MATSIDERLTDVIQTKLAAIATGAGHEQTVVAATRASDEPPPQDVTSMPAVQLRRLGVSKEKLIRAAYECTANYRVVGIAERDSTNEKISDLLADIEKVIQANTRWNDGSVNLAVRTWITESSFHETETDEDTMTGIVDFSVLYRIDSTTPFSLKEI